MTSRYAATGCRRRAARPRPARSPCRPRSSRRRGTCQSRRVADAAGPSTRSATPGRPWRSTPPGADDQVHLAQVDPGSLDDPALGAGHHPRPAGVPAQRQVGGGARDGLVLVALRGRSSGRKPGSSRLCWAACEQLRLVGRLDGGHRRPAHAESPSTVRVTGVGRDHLAGQPVLVDRAVLGVDLDHRVDVGGRATDVDHDHVAGAGVLLVEPAREQLDPGEHHVRRRAADHRREVGAGCSGASRRSRGRRNTSRIAARADPGASTPIRGTTLSASTCGTSPQDLGDLVLGVDVRRPPRPARATRFHELARRPQQHLACCPRPSHRSAAPHRRGRRSSSEALVRTRRRNADAQRDHRDDPPPLDSATRRPASAVTSSSLPITAMRRPPPALEQASTSASAARGPARPARPGTRRTRRGRRSRSWCGARRTRRYDRRRGRPARPW